MTVERELAGLNPSGTNTHTRRLLSSGIYVWFGYVEIAYVAVVSYPRTQEARESIWSAKRSKNVPLTSPCCSVIASSSRRKFSFASSGRLERKQLPRRLRRNSGICDDSLKTRRQKLRNDEHQSKTNAVIVTRHDACPWQRPPRR